MKQRRLFVRILCAVLVALMILSVSVMVIVPALAATKSELRSEISELEDERSDIEDRMADIEAQIDSVDFQLLTTFEKKAVLDEKNALAQEELDVIEEQIAIIDGYLANREADLEAARAEETAQEEAWLTRLRAMEENSDVSYMQVLFESTSFSDLLTRLDLVNELMAYDEELWNSYVTARENVETLEAEAEEMFAENEANKAVLEAKKAQLETDIAAASQMIAELETTLEGYQELWEAEDAAAAEIQALIDEKQAELDEILRLEQAAQQQQTPGGNLNLGGDGSMLWPSDTTLITSYYGNRYLEIYGYWRMHAGVDIGAPYGTPIYAPADGTVWAATDAGTTGYGQYVILSHDNGYTTVCAHMSKRAVTAGQRVSQGQVIGYVGSSGTSTGPHIHFEVRIGGTTINPLSISYIYG